MADRKLYSGLSKKHVLVPAYSVATVDYIDTRPNYFQVQNQGTTAIYCGTASIPNTKQYDFMVAAESLRMFTEPHDRTRLYIYNPSGSDIMTVVLSFNAPFDPLALALSTIEVSMPSEIEASNIIAGFQTSLPAGTNTIGKVGLPDDIKNAILSAGNRNYQNTLDVIKGNQKDYTSVLANILAAIGNIEGGSSSGGSSSWTAANIAALLANVDKLTNSTAAQMETESGEAGTGSYTDFTYDTNIQKINFISNDGEYDMLVKFTNDLGMKNFIVKAGEVLNDVAGNWSMVSVIGSGGVVPYRFVCTRYTA